MDAEKPMSESGPLADWFEWIETDVVQQGREHQGQASTHSDPDDASTGLYARAWLSPADQLAELGVLAPWVNGLQKEYAAAGDWLVPCWWRHRFAVNELAALRIAWLGIETFDKWDAEIDWHESADKCRERIRQAIGDGSGCTTVQHYPDWPVTRDSRWKAENEALLRVLSVDADQPRLTAEDSDSEGAR